MIYVIAAMSVLAVLFLGTALLYVLSDATVERQQYVKQIETLVNKVQHPEIIQRELPANFQVDAMIPEDWGELGKVGTIIYGEDEK